jgi:hypothetical protein
LLTVNAFADIGCRRDCEPPTLGVTYEGKQIVNNGLTINGKAFDVEELTQTLPTTKVRTGEIVKIELVAFENSGAEYLKGTSLSIGKYVDDGHVDVLSTISVSQNFVALLKSPLSSDLDSSQVVTVADPTGLLKDVVVKTSNIDSYRTSVVFTFRVTKPIDTSDIMINTIDAKKNSRTNVFHDAISVTGKQMVEAKAKPPAKHVPAPLKLVKAHSPVVCRDGYELVIRSTGAPACVSTYTAEMMRDRGMVAAN